MIYGILKFSVFFLTAINATRNRGSQLAVLNARNYAGDGWNNIAPFISGLQREAARRLTMLKGVDLQSMMLVHTKPISEAFGRLGDRFSRPPKGMLAHETSISIL